MAPEFGKWWDVKDKGLRRGIKTTLGDEFQAGVQQGFAALIEGGQVVRVEPLTEELVVKAQKNSSGWVAVHGFAQNIGVKTCQGEVTITDSTLEDAVVKGGHSHHHRGNHRSHTRGANALQTLKKGIKFGRN